MIEGPFAIISVIALCAALLAWLASRARQPIIIAYFACGLLLGPHVLGIVTDVDLLDHIARIGVTLLLFLSGMVLHPDRLVTYIRCAGVATLGKCAAMWLLALFFLRAWGYGWHDCSIAALALMFSSTILVVKLLPTTTLHQQRMGSICIAILIAEDLLAIVLIMMLEVKGGSAALWLFAPTVLAKAAAFVAGAILCEQYVLRRMMRTADRYHEVLIMLCIAWCLGLAVLAERIGLSYEVGAFIAGVAMARNKVSLFLSEQLKPMRDFFLMFFFVVLGARFNILTLKNVWLASVLLGVVITLVRPLVLFALFRQVGEERAFSRETAVRLGQASEFALIIAAAAVQSGRLSESMSQCVQLTTIVTMVISSYVVVLLYPTPIGVRKGLQLD